MEKDGKDLEKLVQLINMSIEPDSAVEHNVFLPVIGSPSKRTRQCDIVITSGPKHRQTITLIEVQDRTSKVDINTFNGWLDKLNEVGAQHLVCVSRLEFAESIKEKALLSGNKVKLITMREIDKNGVPLGLFKLKFKYFDFKILKSGKIDLAISKAETQSLGIYDEIKEYLNANKELNFNLKIFSYDQNELICLYKICRDGILTKKGENLGVGKVVFEKDNGKPIFLFINGVFTRISLEVEFDWQNDTIEYPVSILSYDQQNDGSLAWVFEGQNETPSGKISFKIPVVNDEKGFRIGGLITTMPEDVELMLYKENNDYK